MTSATEALRHHLHTLKVLVTGHRIEIERLTTGSRSRAQNYLFVGAAHRGEREVAIYSQVDTAKLNGGSLNMYLIRVGELPPWHISLTHTEHYEVA